MADVDSAADDDADGIVRVCSYHRRDFDLVLICSRPHEMQAAQSLMQIPFATPPTAGLGLLDRLPRELVVMVLHNLDIQSYFRFRQVNRQARVLSTLARPYKLVARYGLEALRSLLRTNLASRFTISQLFAQLASYKCTTCGDFAGFLFLFTLARCCFACIESHPHFSVVAFAFARQPQISVTRLHQQLASVLCTVPGLYSMVGEQVRRPKHLMALTQALPILWSLGSRARERAEILTQRGDQTGLRYMSCTAMPWYDAMSGKVGYGVSCKGCQVRVEVSGGSYADRDRAYSTSGFLAHFQGCMEAQQMWLDSNHGTTPFSEPEATRRGGSLSIFGVDGRLA